MNSSKERMKEQRELSTFLSFAKASRLRIDLESAESRRPPEPDVFCTVGGRAYYFELGELTDESIPRNAAEAKRIGSESHGGPISPLLPLEKMVFEKLANDNYVLNNRRASLLLHYSIGHNVPVRPALNHFLSSRIVEIIAALNKSSFQSIFIFDGWSESVLAIIMRTE